MATKLQHAVWTKLSEIPKGKVVTYVELARAIGKPKAVRAVATAVGKNPNLVVVPCHRVIRSDRSVGKYASGVDKKIALLKSEGINIQKRHVPPEDIFVFDKK